MAIALILCSALVELAAGLMVWNEGTSAELEWGEMLVAGNYSLSLVDFSPEGADTLQVLLDLQRDNVTVATRSLAEGDSFSLNDTIRVTAERIVRDEESDEQYAKLRIQLPAEPELALLLSTDKEVYRGGDTIRVELGVENRGIVDAEGLQITIDSEPRLFEKRFCRSNLEAGRTWDEKRQTREADPIKFDLQAPYITLPADFQLRAFCTFEDREGREYEARGGTRLRVSGSVQLHKMIDESQDFGKGYHVMDTLWNCGNKTTEIELDDSTGSGFVTSEELHWQIGLDPGQTKTLSYEILARKPGTGQVLPPAKARFALGGMDCTLTSESPIVDVLGPFVEVTRDASRRRVSPGETLTVKLNLTNSGNRRAKVFFREAVPGGTLLVGGNNHSWALLDPGESVHGEYTLLCTHPGRLRLPAGEISYHDAGGNSYSCTEPEITIDVEAPKAIPPPTANESSPADEEQAGPDGGHLMYASLAIVLIFGLLFSRYL